MSLPTPRLAYRAALTEQYDAWVLHVVIVTPFLLMAHWWLALAWLAGMWLVFRAR